MVLSGSEGIGRMNETRRDDRDVVVLGYLDIHHLFQHIKYMSCIHGVSEVGDTSVKIFTMAPED